MKIPKIYQRLKRYLGNKRWVRKKRKEIRETIFLIDTNLIIFGESAKNFDSRDGTHDLSIYLMYKLRPTSDGDGPRYTVGSNIENFLRLSRSLDKANLILDRFEKQIKRKGWLYDREAIIKKNREILRKKQKVITSKFNGIQSFESDVSIPN